MKILLKIKKIIDYIPILWKDEDWDYYHLLELIKYKISRMKKCIKNNDLIVDEAIDNISNSIDNTIKCINEYNNSDELFYKEYGDIYEILNLEHRCIGEEFATVYKDTEIKISKRHKAKIKNNILKHLEYERELWNKIWDSIKDNGRSWWD